MAQALDEELAPWRNRSIEQPYPYLVVDARYEYVCENGHIESDGEIFVFLIPIPDMRCWRLMFNS